MATSDTTPRVSTLFYSFSFFFFQKVTLFPSDYSALLLKANATEVLVDQYLDAPFSFDWNEWLEEMNKYPQLVSNTRSGRGIRCDEAPTL